MLLRTIQIFFLANHVQKVRQCALNHDIQETEISSCKNVLNKMENLSNSSHDELPYNQTKFPSLPNTNTNGKTVKDLRDILLAVKTVDSQGKLSTIKNKMKSDYVDVNKEGLTGNIIEFDLRKREDAYKKTDPKEYPYAVSILTVLEKYDITYLSKAKPGLCSGSLLTDEWVLTAHHCFKDYKEKVKIYVYAGGNYAMEIISYLQTNKPLSLTSQLVISTTFIADKGGLDIALVKLLTKFKLTDTVATVKLSSKPWKYHGYHTCVTTGFGTLFTGKESEDDGYRKTHELEVKQPCLCPSFVKDAFEEAYTNDVMCSKPRQDYGICTGDSGGGLVCDGEIVAVNMAGLEFDDVNYCEMRSFIANTIYSILGQTLHECAKKNTLTTFQAVCPSLQFINEHINLFSDGDISECVKLSELHSASVRTMMLFRHMVIVTGISITFCFVNCFLFLL